jgi:hypothetical protein
MSQVCWGVERHYSIGRLVSVQQKSRDKVDMYLVNTPVTTAVPYFEITVRLGDSDYVAEHTLRHSEEELPPDWISGADVSVRLDKHSLFLRRSDGSEVQWIIVKKIHDKK